MQEDNSQKKLAVLIDADNSPPSIIDGLLAEIAKYGIASVRRIYGDWTTPNLRGWKDVLLEQAIQPIQQFRYTVGKNATDSALIIDAMDLLYLDKLDGFFQARRAKSGKTLGGAHQMLLRRFHSHRRIASVGHG